MTPAASSLDFPSFSSSGGGGAGAGAGGTSASLSQQQQQQQQRRKQEESTTELHKRSVARPLVNLGNTCFANAVLQALAHAPELCLAMDCHPHRSACPKAARSPSPVAGTRKSLRQAASGRRSPPEEQIAETSADEFCTLCEVERHILLAHDMTNSPLGSTPIANSTNNGTLSNQQPVAPSIFVHGFIEHVAPWFQLGVQEDSHEFLRLLIDAMQKSCVQARPQKQLNNETNPQGDESEHDPEYPFQLFRGTVESNVVCAHCKAVSSTLDPIEDIGLEVTAPPGPASHSKSSSGRSSSRNPSPTPAPALEDVQSAFRRFARAEELDAQYKCEKCGKFGRATKQSRLARLPPILTLHLKRFRYGDRPVSTATTRRSARTTEVGQLMIGGDSYNNDYYGGASFGGKTGSAKIEGHVKFGTVIDLSPYLTEALQKKKENALCRLFAVIVHSGKNSHSGHYIAYVCNMSNKNEWWKMDDARVTRVTEKEVLQAEAYMLFYRVMSHPVMAQLQLLHSRQQEQLTNSSSKRARQDSYDYFRGWDRRKTNFPPHLRGLIDKVSEMLAEEVPLAKPSVQEIEKEANANAAEGKVSAPMRRNIFETDVVDGTEKYRSVLMDIFGRLQNDPSVELAFSMNGALVDEGGNKESKTLPVPVSVEEPVEDSTLL